ncbi:glycosyltransferase [Chryseolinea sp. H1M3-3]|uniref:glycosyltransferase n=1 Tax=Chryseolinea sp. H1M3-3 TaxID=3034144 RepID=UPI0023ED5389|nr:glycosyltransferase [Chryseolinea sp. H1M3-3]
MKKVLTFSIFKSNLFGHGGEKRTGQIHEILSSDYSICEVLCKFTFNQGKVALKKKLTGSLYIPEVFRATEIYKHNFSVSRLLDESHKVSRQVKNLEAHSELIKEASTIVWENTLPDFFYLPYLIKKKYLKRVIACPHNIESLVPHQTLRFYGRDKLKFLQQELEPFRVCDKVFTISEEEQWLLNLFDIEAQFLPYYPQGELLTSLMSIRKYRETADRNGAPGFFLSVGSLTNAPTKKGMLNLLEQIKKINQTSSTKYNFKIAGSKTDALRTQHSGLGLDILGQIDNIELDLLLKDCRAVVINQGFSTGALTKVPDMLVAGIPVIIDAGGARTYKRYEGIHVYNSSSDLADLLSSQLPLPPIPEMPIKYYKSFLRSLDGPAS